MGSYVEPLDLPQYVPGGGAWLYVLRAAESGRVKVGVATNLRSRVAALRTGCPEELRVAVTLAARTKAGAHWLERWWLAEFARCRIRGEWFAPDADMMGKVDALAAEQQKAWRQVLGFGGACGTQVTG